MAQITESEVPRPIAIYVGRFQPFHKGHFSVYQDLVKKFGADRVFIGTSDKTDTEKSPFGFADKKKIITTLFKVPADKVVQVKNPYAPQEITSQFPPETPVVTSVSEKDADRLKHSKYFVPWNGTSKGGYKDVGHLYIAPVFQLDVDGENISGTSVRKVLGGSSSPTQKQKMFRALYGQDSPEIFDLIVNKLSKPTPAPVQGPDKSVPVASKKTTSKSISGKITNPVTKNRILVKTALSYDKKHPARKLADRLVHAEHRIVEGGAAGHLSHPYEDVSLSFAQIKEMITRAANFSLDREGAVTEKTDGQNLMFTVKNGKIRFARNKGQVKNSGENSLDVDGLRKMFSGRGEIESSFASAAEDLQSAISAAPTRYIDSMFSNGRVFMNIEVINPETKNVIPYNQSILQFHGTVEFDSDGNKVKVDPENGRKFSEMIRSIGAARQKRYGLQGPQIISFSSKQKSDYQAKMKSYLDYVKQLQSKLKLDDTDTIQDYLNNWWLTYIQKKAKSDKVSLTKEQVHALVQRWAGGVKNIGKKDFTDPATLKFFSEIESSHDKLKKSSINPIETLFLKVGSTVIAQSTDTIAANNPLAAEGIRSKVKKIIQRISSDSSMADKLAKLNTELERLDATGGVDGIKPVEGLVFVFNGHLYKFTGSFAPVNQILGMLGFNAKRDEEPAATVDPPKPLPQKKTMSTRTDIMNKRILNPATKNRILVKTALAYDRKHPAYQTARRMLGLSVNEQFEFYTRGYNVR